MQFPRLCTRRFGGLGQIERERERERENAKENGNVGKCSGVPGAFFSSSSSRVLSNLVLVVLGRQCDDKAS